MKKILLFAAICLSISAYSQPGDIPADLSEKLQDKRKLHDYMETIYNYYGFRLNEKLDSTRKANIDKSVLRALKQWNRWAYFMDSRTAPDGTLADVNSLWMQNDPRSREKTSAPLGTSSSTGSWSLIGPSNVHYGHGRIIGVGRMDRIAFHPTDPDTYFVTSGEGGVWKTSDGGSSYTCLTDNLPLIGASGIVVDYSNPSILYILSGNGDNNGRGLVGNSGFSHSCLGVYKSVDGGNSWQLAGELAVPGTYLGYQIVQSPTDPKVLLAATDDGVYRTENGGAGAWVRVTPKGTFHDVKFKPGSGSIAYCCGIVNKKMVFYYSLDGGMSWQPASFDFSIDKANRCSIGVSPDAPSKVYLICGPGNLAGGKYTGCFVSINNGINFTRINNGPTIFLKEDGTGSDQSRYDNCIAVKPTDASRIITGGLVVFRSTNGGLGFGAVTTYLDGVAFERDDHIHPDVHAVAYNPLNNKLYACSDGGVFVSNDDGTSWSRRYNGLAAAQIYHLAKLDGSNTQFMAGNQDNGIHTRYSDNGDFTQSVQGDGFDMDFFDNTNNRFFAVINTKVYKFFSEGLTNKELMDFAPAFLPAMSKHLTDDDMVFIGDPTLNRFYTYDLDGIDDISTDAIPASWCIRQALSNTSRIYTAGTNSVFSADSGQLYRTDDRINWTRLDNNPGFPDLTKLNTRITSIAIQPNDHQKIWVSFGGFFNATKVFFSSNGGDSWTNISGTLPNLPANSLAADKNGNIYAGTDNGVYFRGNGWADWKPFYNGLPRVPVTDLIITSDDRIFASTFGRSIWASPVYSDCPETLDISGKQEGQKFYEASVTVNSTGTSNQGAGTAVFYRAGDKVDLKEGFEAGNNSEVRIYNGPCGSGVPSSLKMPANEDDFTGFRQAAMPTANEMEFPYAYISNWLIQNGKIDFKIVQVSEGETKLILVSGDGKKIKELWKGNSIGKSRFSFDIPEINNRKCSVLLFYNNTLVHWQDLN